MSASLVSSMSWTRSITSCSNDIHAAHLKTCLPLWLLANSFQLLLVFLSFLLTTIFMITNCYCFSKFWNIVVTQLLWKSLQPGTSTYFSRFHLWWLPIKHVDWFDSIVNHPYCSVECSHQVTTNNKDNWLLDNFQLLISQSAISSKFL